MSFPDPLALKNSSAAAVSLTRRLPIPNGNRYTDVASTPTKNTSCDIRTVYTPAKSGKDAYNRSIATFSIKRVDGQEVEHTGSLSLSLVRPLNVDITDADMADLFAMLSEFLIAASGDYKTRFMRNEV
jgi:hypothetical protein